MPTFNPFGSLMEVDRYIEADKLKRQQLAKTNALAEMRAQQSASPRAFNPVQLVGETAEDRILATPTYTPRTGETTMTPFDLPEGYRLQKPTAQQSSALKIQEAQGKADIEISTARKKEQEKVTGKNIAQRLSGQIDTAYESAGALPVIKRSLDLMAEVETGGIDAVRLKAKQFLGVESADEAELTQNLSKAVLKQLKPTFGAQFTKAEGDFLKSIEAGLGKSTAGNKRILQRALKVYERGIKRGMRAARRQGDTATYQELKDTLEYTVEAQQGTTTQPAAIKFLGFE